MALGLNQTRNMTDYIRGGKFSSGTLGYGVWLRPADTPVNGEFVYLDKVGLVQNRAISTVSAVHVIRWDPQLLDNTSPAVFTYNAASSLVNSNFQVSAYVPSTGEQKLFGRNGSTIVWKEVDYTNPQVDIDASPFPLIRTTSPDPSSGYTSLVDGYWSTASGRGDQLFFLGWDRTNSGNTIGTAMMFGVDTTRFGGANVVGCTNYINMATGEAEPQQELISYYTTSPANDFQGGPYLGSTSLVQFKWAQFVPDFDSLPNAPKGRIYLSDTLSSGNARSLFVLGFDFNPEGVTSFPERIHWRVFLRSRFDLERTTNYAVFPGADSNLIPTSAAPSCFLRLNPTTGRLFTADSRQSGNTTVFDSDVYHTALAEATAVPVIDVVTPPVERIEVTTNRVAVLGSDVRGDLGERIPGETVDWTLERITTRGEILGVTPTPGETVLVANPTISENANYPLEVRKDGVPMTRVTEWDLNGPLTGVTFVSPEPVGGSVYAIDYGHPSSPATPAFGTLLTASSISDEEGSVTCRIRYPDDDEDAGFVDQLTAETVN